MDKEKRSSGVYRPWDKLELDPKFVKQRISEKIGAVVPTGNMRLDSHFTIGNMVRQEDNMEELRRLLLKNGHERRQNDLEHLTNYFKFTRFFKQLKLKSY